MLLPVGSPPGELKSVFLSFFFNACPSLYREGEFFREGRVRESAEGESVDAVGGRLESNNV